MATEKRLLRLPEVRSRTGLSTGTIYRRMNQGTFPRPVDIGGKLVAWPESSIDAWISAKLEAADRKAAECDRETEAA